MRHAAWDLQSEHPQSRFRLDWQWWTAGAITITLGLAAIFAAPPSILAQPDLNQPAIPTPPPEEQEGIETLTQGPIHEAFANPSDLDPTPGPVVAKQPPADIAEEPPEFMPEDSVWISGYWIWDDERDDFIWVTGVARKIPPGMRYVPGYWMEVAGGYQRVSGFWTSADAAELEYREPPPNTLETGPSSPAPAENYFWVPGNWNYYDTGYRWRAGYWSPYQSDWVWCPARWAWTPAGCVYLPGYWDYRLAYRGQMFAPVYFSQPIYTRPNWSYRPWCAIPTTNLFIHLWIRPNYCHYYFGNYYGPQYANFGFNSWCNYPTRRYHYDPFLTYCNVHYRRQGVDFVGRVRGWHDHYDRHEDQRPPRTWREQQTFVAQRDNRVSVQTQLMASNVVDVAKRNDAPIKLAKIDNQKRQSIVERNEKLRELNTARKQVEREASKVAVQLPRDNDARPGRDNDARPGRDNDDRGPDRGKTGDRDNLPGKGKADDRDVARDKGGKGDRSDKADKGGTLIDRAEDKGSTKGPPGGNQGATKGGRGGPGPKLTLPKEPGVTGRDVPRPGADADGKAGPERRDNIPPPMPKADDDGQRGPNRGPTDRGTGDRGSKGGRGDAGDRGGKTGAPRPNLPGVNVPGDSPSGGLPKSGGAKAGGAKAGVPKVEAPRINPPGDRPGDRGGDRPGGGFSKGGAPKVESPSPGLPKGGTPKADAPRVEPPRSNRPTFDAPKADRPRPDNRPKSDNRPKTEAKRIEVPNVEQPREVPRIQPQPRVEAPQPQPRVEIPRASAPRNEAPRNEAPRVAPRFDAPRPNPAPRVEAPRPAPAPRVEAPRVEAPRGQPQPRNDAPRGSDSTESGQNRGRGKNKNRD